MLKTMILAAVCAASILAPASAEQRQVCRDPSSQVVKSWQIDKPLTVQRPARKKPAETAEVKYSTWAAPTASRERQWTIIKSETLRSPRLRNY